MDPSELLDLVKDNVVVQWFLVAVFILLVGTNTATKISGPLGKFARWVRDIGEKRDAREAAERREKRRALLKDAAEGREFIQTEMDQLHGQIRYLYANQHAMEGLIRAHLGWDYERIRQLIELGVRPESIPQPPPLRVELKNPEEFTRSASRPRRRATDTDENPQVQPAID
jgi:hypothetical protein